VGLVVACGQSKRDGGGASESGGEGGSTDETGGSAGSSAGRGGSTPSGGASGSSNDSCGDVTRNGRCTENVYEWCDYFTGSIARLDCTPLGATCRALESQTYEDESNGCVTSPCDTGQSGCDGSLCMQCEDDGIVINDCAKFGGPGSVCDPSGTSFW
jgi:hypothetical protein